MGLFDSIFKKNPPNIQNKESNPEEVKEYLKKYVRKKPLDVTKTYATLHTQYRIPRDSLEPIRKKIIKDYELNEKYSNFDSLRESLEQYISFLDDLESFYKLFKGKGVIIGYDGIYKAFQECVKEYSFEIYDYMFYPFINRWKQQYGEGIDKKTLVLEIVQIKSNIIQDDGICPIDGTMLGSEAFEYILSKFNIETSSKELEGLINSARQEEEVKRFERSLNSDDNVKTDNLIGVNLSSLDGYEFEEYVGKIFRAMGYKVTITNKSNDQGADLIVEDWREKIAVQTKNYNKPVSNSAVQEVVASKAYYSTDRAMVVTSNTFTDSALKLAGANNVVLWDGTKIKQIIRELSDHTENEEDIDYRNIMEIDCPYCGNKFIFDINTTIKDEEGDIVQCPKCGKPILISYQ